MPESIPKDEVSDTTTWDAHRWDRLGLALLSAGVLVATVWLFILQPTYDSTMVEYVYKFLPALTDHGVAAVFDGNGLGDPRSRLLANLLALVNVRMRGFISQHALLHPGLSVNWLLYPACLWLLFHVVKRLTGNRQIALFTVLLYAASPALLDTLVDYYVPAKPLSNFMMLLAIYGGCLLFPRVPKEGARVSMGFLLVFTAGMFGLFSDETGVFIYLCVPLLFADKFFSNQVAVRHKVSFFVALLVSGSTFLVISFLMLPLVNTRLGQVPVDLWSVITKGVYWSMFGRNVSPLGPLVAQYSPGSLLETIISVHAVPGRFVFGVYTSGFPINHFFHWPARDQLGFYLFLAAFLLLMFRLARSLVLWALEWRLLGAFCLFVLVQAFLLLRLAPWIIETNYYAAFASLFFALIIGVALGGLVQDTHSRWIAVLFCGYLIAVQFSNFLATAKRHPSFDTPPLTWGMLSEVRREVNSGHFASVAKAHPFPSRIFSWAFECAVAEEHSRGRLVDIQPFAEPSENLYGFVDMRIIPKITGYADIGLNIAAPKNEKALLTAGARLVQGPLDRLFLNSYVEGQSGPWNYVRRFDALGHIEEQYWRNSLIRLWADRGTVSSKNNEVCLTFEKAGVNCISRIYEYHGVRFAFSHAGQFVTLFRTKPLVSHPNGS